MSSEVWTIRAGQFKSMRNLCYKGKPVAILDQGSEPIVGWIAILKTVMEFREESPSVISYGLKEKKKQ